MFRPQTAPLAVQWLGLADAGRLRAAWDRHPRNSIIAMNTWAQKKITRLQSRHCIANLFLIGCFLRAKLQCVLGIYVYPAVYVCAKRAPCGGGTRSSHVCMPISINRSTNDLFIVWCKNLHRKLLTVISSASAVPLGVRRVLLYILDTLTPTGAPKRTISSVRAYFDLFDCSHEKE
jgi:hypothetical protein